MQQLKTGLLSYGMSGKVFHAPFLALHPGFELVSVWERSSKNVQNDYPQVKSCDSLEELLSSDVGLIIVNTPVYTHFEYAKKAILAGKHVVVEKAFTATVAEAEELHELAIRKKVTLSVFQNRRWDSDFKTVEDIYRKNIIGDIVEAEIHFDRYNPKLSPKQHKEVANSGSGVLRDLGSHIIDQALYLFGFPDELFADIRITREESVVDDWFDITLFYPKFRVRLKAGFFVREPLPSYVLHGKIGSFIKSRGDVQEDDLKAGKIPMVNDWGKEPQYKSGVLHTEIEGVVVRENMPTIPGNYYDYFDQLYQSIKKKSPVPVSAEDGIRTMRIIEAAELSNKEKKTIKLWS